MTDPRNETDPLPNGWTWEQAIDVLSCTERGLSQVVEGDGGFIVEKFYRADGLASKMDQCAHGQFKYQGCANCAEVILDRILTIIRDALAKARAGK